MSIKRNILLNPGPVTTTNSVKMAQVVPDICPREKDFGRLLNSISKDLTNLSGNNLDYVTILFGGSGTAGLDATINSVVAPKSKILVINNGAYGKRMAEIATTYSIDLHELKFRWNEIADTKEIEKVLKKDKKIQYVAVVHHETTTGILNPLKKIGNLAKKYKKTFIVDAISSFGGIPFNINECNIDFMVSVANKCLQGMPGICFVVCKKKELEKLKNYPKRSYYLNLFEQYQFFRDKQEMRFTPPVQIAYSLRKAIDELLEEGIHNRCKRYVRNFKVLKEGIAKLGFHTLLKPEHESRLLITVKYPKHPNFRFEELHDRLYAKGFTIYPGKIGALQTFRLAVIGDLKVNDIDNFLVALDIVMDEMKINLIN